MKRAIPIFLVVCLLLTTAAPALAAPLRDTTYVVRAGDTLSAISVRFGVSMGAIIAANHITNPNLIYVGTTLIIPGVGGGTPPPPVGGGGSCTYTVRPGDTLFAIAVRNGTTVAAMVAANSITNPNLIFVGTVLKIPSGSCGTPPPNPPPPGPNPTATPPPPPPPPPIPGGSFELGGQVDSFAYPDKMKYAGMVWVKRQVRWGPGANASDHFGLISDAHGKGFKVLLTVLGDAGSISGGANYDDFAAFAGNLAAAGADAIEVWNEMNLDREWPTGQISPASYTDLLRRSYSAIKAKNGGTLVISGALAPTGAESVFGLDHVWNDIRYIQGMAAAGAASYADCIGVHYNEGIISPTQSSGDPRGGYFTRYYPGMVNTYFANFGGARKLCFTELGYLTGEGYPDLATTAPSFAWAAGTSVAQQAQWLAEATSLSASGGKVRMMIIFNVDLTTYGPDPQAGYAIMRPGGGCPACDSLHAVTGGR